MKPRNVLGASLAGPEAWPSAGRGGARGQRSACHFQRQRPLTQAGLGAGEGSWQAEPRRKPRVCAVVLAEPGRETACSSFQSEGAYDVILPRATANSQVMGSANSTLRAEDMYAAQSHQVATPSKDDKNSQVFRNPYVWD